MHNEFIADTWTYDKKYKKLPFHPTHFEYSDGETIGIHHLIAAYTCCKFDTYIGNLV